MSHPRVSPKGDVVAFLDHPTLGDDEGSVVVVDRAGKSTVLSKDWITAYGLVWSGDGKEIWFTATRVGVARSIWSASLEGNERLLARTPGELTIQDASADGRILMTSDNGKVGIIGRPPGYGTGSRPLSPRLVARARHLAGREADPLRRKRRGRWGAPRASTSGSTDGSPAVHLGDGWAGNFSPDGRWVASQSMAPEGRRITLLPTKAGEPRELPRTRAAGAPGVVAPGRQAHPRGGERARRGTPPLRAGRRGRAAPADHARGHRDGLLSRLSGRARRRGAGSGRALHGFPIEGGDPEYIPGLVAEDRPIRFSPDGKALFAYRRGELPAHVIRLDLGTGEKHPSQELMPPDAAGVVEIVSVVLTPDFSSYAYSYHRILSDLFLVEGLK